MRKVVDLTLDSKSSMDVFWLLLVYTIIVSTISLHFLPVSLHADCNTFECCTLCSEGKLGQLLDAESFHTVLSMVETDLFPYAPVFPRSAISVRLPCRVVRRFFLLKHCSSHPSTFILAICLSWAY